MMKKGGEEQQEDARGGGGLEWFWVGSGIGFLLAAVAVVVASEFTYRRQKGGAPGALTRARRTWCRISRTRYTREYTF